MTGWGQDGPDAGRPGTTSPTSPSPVPSVPARPPTPARAGNEPARRLHRRRPTSWSACWRALHESRASGAGQVVDAAMGRQHRPPAHDVSRPVGRGCLARRPWRNLLDGGAPFYGTYRTSDGGWMAVGALEPAFFDELLTRLAIDPQSVDRNDPARWPELRDLIAESLRDRHPGRLDRGLRRQRRVRRAGPRAGRRDPAPAPRRAWHVRRARRRDAAGTGTALLPYAGSARPAAARTGAAHRRGARRVARLAPAPDPAPAPAMIPIAAIHQTRRQSGVSAQH